METKQKQSLSAMNRPIVSEKTKDKLSKISKGLKRSEETKKKLSEAAKQREKNKIGKYKKVQCLNTGEIFNSLREAANWCGLVGTSGIASVCNRGKQKTAGVHPVTKEKLKWKYI